MKAKIIKMPERGGAQITWEGVEIGPEITKREALIVCRWLDKAAQNLQAFFLRRNYRRYEGWECQCACHRLRQMKTHCAGCHKMKAK